MMGGGGGTAWMKDEISSCSKEEEAEECYPLSMNRRRSRFV